MDTKELNEYIKNYLDNDKTQRAIMLTAPWGSGKSYYIKNGLCPFLFKKKKKYAVVSLYGIKNLNELNKSLYIELKASFLSKQTEKQRKVNIVGRTIIKGITSFFGVDISQSEEQWQELYKSVDLKNSLIIFEDVERSGIDIIEFLGYVNSITENDRAKVLIVANETELIKRVEVVKERTDNSTSKEYVVDEKGKRYLLQKEKSIGDTIYFCGNSLEIIESVYSNFDNTLFQKMINHQNEFTKNNIYLKIQDVMSMSNCCNYRSLLYACQKTEDVFQKLTRDDYHVYFLQNVLLGTIAHCIGPYHNNYTNVWKDMSITSSTLGSLHFPLYRFMFDYIKYQDFNVADFDFAYGLFLNSIEYAKNDKSLNIIYNYITNSQTVVEDALTNVYQGLKTNKGISYNDYVKIANYLISIKFSIGYEEIVDECRGFMKTNLQNVSSDEKVHFYTDTGIQLHSDEAVEEFNDWKQELFSIIEKNNCVMNFDYMPESIIGLYERINQNGSNILKNGFAININVERMLDMILNCSANQLNDLRGIFLGVYRNYSDAKMRYSNDIDNLEKLKKGINIILDNNENLDKIQKFQLRLMRDNLSLIIKELKGEHDGI